MVLEEKKLAQVYMKESISDIVGTLLIELLTIYCLNFKDILIIMKMVISLIKHFAVIKKAHNFLMVIL